MRQHLNDGYQLRVRGTGWTEKRNRADSRPLSQAKYLRVYLLAQDSAQHKRWWAVTQEVFEKRRDNEEELLETIRVLRNQREDYRRKLSELESESEGRIATLEEQVKNLEAKLTVAENNHELCKRANERLNKANRFLRNVLSAAILEGGNE